MVVSIRCREGRTAERRAPGEAYENPDIDKFLFAVAKGVQRNAIAVFERGWHARFYSLSRRAYSGTRARWSGPAANRVSIRCREGRTAEPRGFRCHRCHAVSIRCREGRTAEPLASTVVEAHRLIAVSIRCREGRTAEHTTTITVCNKERVFLFAVAKGVQRNPTPSGEAVTSTNDVRFHTRRPEAFGDPSSGPLQSAFVLVRALHTRGISGRFSRQPLVTQVTSAPGGGRL